MDSPSKDAAQIPSRVMSSEKATEEINRWLDHKKMGPARREAKKIAIDGLIDAMVEGHLTLTENFHLVYKLKFPIRDDEGGSAVDVLDFIPRIRAEQITRHLQKVNANDIKGQLKATAAALTRKPTAIIGKLDSEDLDIVESIAVFFV